MWALAPKSHSSGTKVIVIATDIAVCNFNDRFNSTMQIMQVLNLVVSPNCYNFCAEVDAWCNKATEHSLTDTPKEARKALLLARKEAKDSFMGQASQTESNIKILNFTEKKAFSKSLNAFFTKQHF